MVDARVSASLGSIVTELVINALKYAFPDGQRGTITVDHNLHGPNWVLWHRHTADRSGLGTNLVVALAAPLDASMDIAAAYPGTQVSITYSGMALVENDPEAVRAPRARAHPTSSAL